MFYIKREHEYLIRRTDFIDPNYYLLDVLRDQHSIIDAGEPKLEVVRWTAVLNRAWAFPSEEAVETYKYEYLRHKPCEIIRAR
jgi:hypothetical protein